MDDKTNDLPPLVVTKEDLVEHFPFSSLRGHQDLALAEAAVALTNPKIRFLVIQAPTGSGKSALAVSIGGAIGSSYLLTMNKLLQEQYKRDFGYFMADLRGRANYVCTKTKQKKLLDPNCCSPHPEVREQLGCNGAKKDGEDEEGTKCPYYQAIEAARASSFTLMNFAAGLCFMNYTPHFGKRDVLIIDEAHALEDQLTSFIEFSISDDDLIDTGLYNQGEMTPDLPKVAQYLPWLKDLKARGEDLVANKNRYSGNLEKLESVRGKLGTIIKVIEEDPTNLVLQKELGTLGRVIKLKINPIVVSDYAHNYMFKFAEKVILMSATIGDPKVFASTLGIPQDEMAFIDVASTFPKENRPIFLTTTRKLNATTVESAFSSIVNEVAALMKRHAGDKGIIHVPSYDLAKRIDEALPIDQHKRILFPTSSSQQDALLMHHSFTKEPTVLLSPSMAEGLNLKDDLSRFQIIVKVPYASLGDELVKARLKKFPAAYGQKALIRLIQAYGRSIRSETDYAKTYILDGKFLELVNEYWGATPKWFTEAFNAESVKNIRRE